MKILVCLKQILDPDLPARDFQIDDASKEAKRGGANLVTNMLRLAWFETKATPG